LLDAQRAFAVLLGRFFGGTGWCGTGLSLLLCSALTSSRKDCLGFLSFLFSLLSIASLHKAAAGHFAGGIAEGLYTHHRFCWTSSSLGPWTGRTRRKHCDYLICWILATRYTTTLLTFFAMNMRCHRSCALSGSQTAGRFGRFDLLPALPIPVASSTPSISRTALRSNSQPSLDKLLRCGFRVLLAFGWANGAYAALFGGLRTRALSACFARLQASARQRLHRVPCAARTPRRVGLRQAPSAGGGSAQLRPAVWRLP